LTVGDNFMTKISYLDYLNLMQIELERLADEGYLLRYLEDNQAWDSTATGDTRYRYYHFNHEALQKLADTEWETLQLQAGDFPEAWAARRLGFNWRADWGCRPYALIPD